MIGDRPVIRPVCGPTPLTLNRAFVPAGTQANPNLHEIDYIVPLFLIIQPLPQSTVCTWRVVYVGDPAAGDAQRTNASFLILSQPVVLSPPFTSVFSLGTEPRYRASRGVTASNSNSVGFMRGNKSGRMHLLRVVSNYTFLLRRQCHVTGNLKRKMGKESLNFVFHTPTLRASSISYSNRCGLG
jgi:hypothetical protein